MATSPHQFTVQVYYEDTDHSGVVYHANYLKFFERAREHVLGPAHLVRMWREDGVGFVVYRAELTYRKGAEFGDTLTISTSVERESDYRLRFLQNALRGPTLLVEGVIELVCVNRDGALIALPAELRSRLLSSL